MPRGTVFKSKSPVKEEQRPGTESQVVAQFLPTDLTATPSRQARWTKTGSLRSICLRRARNRSISDKMSALGRRSSFMASKSAMASSTSQKVSMVSVMVDLSTRLTSIGQDRFTEFCDG